MKHALILAGVVGLAFGAAHLSAGYNATYAVGYGALTLMAGLISVTFLVLWAARATPLALGMAFSWAGTSSVMGWWWLYNLLGRPAVMVDHAALFGFLSLYFVGAILHFLVMERSWGLPRGLFLLPVVAATGLSALLYRVL